MEQSQLTSTLLDVKEVVRQQRLELLTEPVLPASMRRDVWGVCGQPTEKTKMPDWSGAARPGCNPRRFAAASARRKADSEVVLSRLSEVETLRTRTDFLEAAEVVFAHWHAGG